MMECTRCGKMRGKNFSSVRRDRDPRLSTTGTFCNPTVKMTHRIKAVVSVVRLEFMQIGHIDVIVESITIRPHAIRSCANGF